jgi:DNA-directed RNA polymerase subunit L
MKIKLTTKLQKKKKLDLEIPEENHGFGNLIKFETL